MRRTVNPAPQRERNETDDGNMPGVACGATCGQAVAEWDFLLERWPSSHATLWDSQPVSSGRALALILHFSLSGDAVQAVTAVGSAWRSLMEQAEIALAVPPRLWRMAYPVIRQNSLPSGSATTASPSDGSMKSLSTVPPMASTLAIAAATS